MVQDYFRDFSFGLATNARACKGVGVEHEAQESHFMLWDCRKV